MYHCWVFQLQPPTCWCSDWCSSKNHFQKSQKFPCWQSFPEMQDHSPCQQLQMKAKWHSFFVSQYVTSLLYYYCSSTRCCGDYSCDYHALFAALVIMGSDGIYKNKIIWISTWTLSKRSQDVFWEVKDGQHVIYHITYQVPSFLSKYTQCGSRFVSETDVGSYMVVKVLNQR